MSGAFEWLDTLTSQIGDVAGKAVTAAGAVASAKIAAEQTRATAADTTPPPSTSPTQTAKLVYQDHKMMIFAGAAVLSLVGLYFFKK